MSEVTVWQQKNPALSQRGIDEPMWNALLSTVYPGAKEESVIMAVDYCRARKLDIMLKPVHLVPMQVKDARTGNKEWRDVPMPGIGLYRVQADRSGNYAGADEPEFGETITEEFDHPYNANQKIKVRYPEWCKYTVYKIVGGHRVAYTSKEYWLENYATASAKTDAPNAMWKKRPFAQLAKCFDENTEVLTTEGFQRFGEVSGRILQVTDKGLEETEALPFVQNYEGPMVAANGTRLNFCVTPNHDMLTNRGKIEAGKLYEQATKDASKWSIPRVVNQSRADSEISDELLALIGYLLADGSHTGYQQFRVAVSRPHKAVALEALGLHSRMGVKKDAGRTTVAGSRTIQTSSDKQVFSYDFALVSSFMSAEKKVSPEWILSLSSRQAKIVVDALLEFDGSHNGTVRRLHQNNAAVIKAFELLAIQAGYSISKAATQKSDIGNCSMFTLSEAKSSPVVKGLEHKNTASLTLESNEGGKVWCVTVPSGVIVVRRNGFSMLCGNCAEAQALRKGWPEIGSEPTAEEMEGKAFANDERDITPQRNGRPSPAQIAQQKQEQQQEALPDMSEKIAFLQDVAQAEGSNGFKSAWKSLSDDEKAAIGIAERNRILEMAKQAEASSDD